MEYRERIPVKKYRPLFGYGYNPEEERRAKKEAVMPADGRETMPVPAESPVVTLIALLILWLAFLIGAIVATHMESRHVTRLGDPVRMQVRQQDDTDVSGEYDRVIIL